MQINRDEISKEVEQIERDQKKPTMKGIKYKPSLMKNINDKMSARLIRKCAVIEDLFYSSRNITAAQ